MVLEIYRDTKKDTVNINLMAEQEQYLIKFPKVATPDIYFSHFTEDGGIIWTTDKEDAHVMIDKVACKRLAKSLDEKRGVISNVKKCKVVNKNDY